MEKFQGKRISREYKQINYGDPNEVFPLLCLVRESDWLPNFHADVIYSLTGISEDGGIFQTDDDDGNQIPWIITRYEPNKLIEMIYLVPDVRVVRINIQLTPKNKQLTEINIIYTQTGLSEKGNIEVNKFTEERFNEQMDYWEKAINYYLKNNKLISSEELYSPSYK